MEVRVFERFDVLARPVAAANQYHDTRPRLFVEITEGGHVGYGEVSPLLREALGDPSLDDVRGCLCGPTLDRLVEVVSREARVPAWSRVHLMASGEPEERWATAAVEMALLDLELVRAGRSLASAWSVVPSDVAALATTSIDEVGSFAVPEGCSRVRVKTRAGADVARMREPLGTLGVPVLLDFNASAGSLDEVVRQVDGLRDHVDLVAVEQPFAPGDLATHALAARELGVAISLDESVRGVSDLRLIARHAAAAMVCVKSARVGGLAVARDVLGEAGRLGLRSYVGGFFESPLGRRASAALAAGFPVEPSDVAPVSVTSDAKDLERSVGVGVVPDLTPARLLGGPWRVDT